MMNPEKETRVWVSDRRLRSSELFEQGDHLTTLMAHTFKLITYLVHHRRNTRMSYRIREALAARPFSLAAANFPSRASNQARSLMNFRLNGGGSSKPQRIMLSTSTTLST